MLLSSVLLSTCVYSKKMKVRTEEQIYLYRPKNTSSILQLFSTSFSLFILNTLRTALPEGRTSLFPFSAAPIMLYFLRNLLYKYSLSISISPSLSYSAFTVPSSVAASSDVTTVGLLNELVCCEISL